ncbi:MAG TPA: PmoA family protein [Natronosporangium sp.]|nr:PmoA family protein [Natronosporangium sp.]
MSGEVVTLRVGDRAVAEYVVSPDLEPQVAPRPYLHPVRTWRGTVVTDALPADHRWHLGASLAVPDVSGTNLWGGRTYVRGHGYTWRDDHGRIVHDGFLTEQPGHVVQRLRWCDRAGNTLLTERRQLRARSLPGRPEAWVLEVGYALTAPEDRPVSLGSPATNGRPGGAGYGGFFWRAAPAAPPPRVFTATVEGEEKVNGGDAGWVALVAAAPAAYSLVFAGLGEKDRWFVRSSMYPGVCAAFAFEEVRIIPAGRTFARRHTVVVVDGAVTPGEAGELVAAATSLATHGDPALHSGALVATG